jgi:hypothetical protein
MDFHEERMKKLSFIESLFEQDIEKLDFYCYENSLKFNEILLTKGMKDPIIWDLIKKEIISFETSVLIDCFSFFSEIWYPLNPLTREWRNKLFNYKYVIDFRKKDLKKIQLIYKKVFV